MSNSRKTTLDAAIDAYIAGHGSMLAVKRSARPERAREVASVIVRLFSDLGSANDNNGPHTPNEPHRPVTA